MAILSFTARHIAAEKAYIRLPLWKNHDVIEMWTYQVKGNTFKPLTSSVLVRKLLPSRQSIGSVWYGRGRAVLSKDLLESLLSRPPMNNASNSFSLFSMADLVQCAGRLGANKPTDQVATSATKIGPSFCRCG